MRSEIACLVVTHQMTAEAIPWMKRAREVFGRLVIFIDRHRASADAERHAQAVGAEVHFSDSAMFFASDFRAMVKACDSEWIFFLDHDEELSPEWSDPSWRSILQNTEFTHFLCSRRWVLRSGNWIGSSPWWPDFQLRLFRANSATRFPSKPHEPLAVAGPAALLRHLSIHHHIWLLDQPARHAKAKFYDTLLPGGALDYFYLYEQFNLKEQQIPPPAAFDPRSDVVTMPRLDPAMVGAIGLEDGQVPERIGPGELFWPEAILRNGAEATLVSAPGYPVRLSYHWRDAISGATEVVDGLRTEIVDPIKPSETRAVEYVVISPARPGIFELELTVVQEQNFWFEEVIPGFGKRFQIQVG
ncbi:MAG TPA: hypothetical protein VM940_06715 [Chthoniobacterales bacterium]|nr:hypothetical protein [Chthoniobacterales bacterium]